MYLFSCTPSCHTQTERLTKEKEMAQSTNKCEVHHLDISIPNKNSALLKGSYGFALNFLIELR